jgi:1-acyl-sn-glycerol-3-phosphate acyltransferase
VAIRGSYDVFERTGQVKAVPILVSFAPPIRIEDLPQEERRNVLADRIHGIIAAALES